MLISSWTSIFLLLDKLNLFDGKLALDRKAPFFWLKIHNLCQPPCPDINGVNGYKISCFSTRFMVKLKNIDIVQYLVYK